MNTPSRRMPPALLGMAVVAGLAGRCFAQDAVRLEERFTARYQYHVSTRVQLTGSLSVPGEKDKQAPKPVPFDGHSAIEYDEVILGAGASAVEKTARIYRRVELERTLGGRKQESKLRPEVRRLVLLRRDTSEVPFSPDGPLTWDEIDLIRTDVFTPALTGLLPDRPVRPGERWAASAEAVREITDLEEVEEGRLECRLDLVTTVDRRRHARVALSGSVRGTNEDGPNRQTLGGFFYFDLESNHLSYLYLDGIHLLVDKDAKELGRVTGKFILTRQAHTRSGDLSEEVIRKVALEPDADNTRLLYDNPALGLRFLYPRRWRVTAVRGPQVLLDAPDGSSLVLTKEQPKDVPTAQHFLDEARAYLDKNKARVLRVAAPQQVRGGTQALEQFGVEVDLDKQRLYLDYYVARQERGGATMAARLLAENRAALQREVEGIARSLQVTK